MVNTEEENKLKHREEVAAEKKRIADAFELSVMQQQEKKLAEDKTIKIIPETLEACVLPDFKMKILPHAHTKKITDKLVKFQQVYEREYPNETARYEGELLSTKKIFNLVLLKDGKPFTDADFEEAANNPTIGLGALNKLTKKLYVFLVVEGGKAGLGF